MVWSAPGNDPWGGDGLDAGRVFPAGRTTAGPWEGVQGAQAARIWENLGMDSWNCRRVWVGREFRDRLIP